MLTLTFLWAIPFFFLIHRSVWSYITEKAKFWMKTDLIIGEGLLTKSFKAPQRVTGLRPSLEFHHMNQSWTYRCFWVFTAKAAAPSQVTERGRVGVDREVLYWMGGGLTSRRPPRCGPANHTHSCKKRQHAAGWTAWNMYVVAPGGFVEIVEVSTKEGHHNERQ